MASMAEKSLMCSSYLQQQAGGPAQTWAAAAQRQHRWHDRHCGTCFSRRRQCAQTDRALPWGACHPRCLTGARARSSVKAPAWSCHVTHKPPIPAPA